MTIFTIHQLGHLGGVMLFLANCDMPKLAVPLLACRLIT